MKLLYPPLGPDTSPDTVLAIQQDSLMPYVSSAEQTRTADPGSLEAQQAVRRLRRILSSVADGRSLEDPERAGDRGERHRRDALTDGRLRAGALRPLMQALRSLEEEFGSLGREPQRMQQRLQERLPSWRQSVDGIYNSLTEIRRRAAVGIS
jgi:hypothetical protein